MAGALYPRFSADSVALALTDTPVAVLQGARQVGKSTIVQQLASQRHVPVFTLDDPVTLAFAREDPVAFVARQPTDMLVIDEAQRAPELILPLKAAVDADRRPGRFLLTGSADLLQVKGVADSLAGRAETIEMMPLSQGELERRRQPEDFVSWILSRSTADMTSRSWSPLRPDAVLRGGFPEAVARAGARARTWFASYLARLASHDARELQHGGYADQLSALVRLIAAQGQSELVRAKIARDLGISQSSADSYLRLTKTMRLTLEIPAWTRGPRGRLVRRPKTCLVDTGLSAALAKFGPAAMDRPGGREFYGSLVEQFVALELSKQSGWSETPFELYHYRDHDGLEVDLIAETHDGEIIAIEIKSGQTITEKSWRNLDRLRALLPDRRFRGVLLHAGSQAAYMNGWLHVLPITSVWRH